LPLRSDGIDLAALGQFRRKTMKKLQRTDAYIPSG
jgi:hypothetical protein